MDILQNELVFDRLSGSAGNITAVSMGEKVRPRMWPDFLAQPVPLLLLVHIQTLPSRDSACRNLMMCLMALRIRAFGLALLTEVMLVAHIDRSDIACRPAQPVKHNFILQYVHHFLFHRGIVLSIFL